MIWYINLIIFSADIKDCHILCSSCFFEKAVSAYAFPIDWLQIIMQLINCNTNKNSEISPHPTIVMLFGGRCFGYKILLTRELGTVWRWREQIWLFSLLCASLELSDYWTFLESLFINFKPLKSTFLLLSVIAHAESTTRSLQIMILHCRFL